MIKYAIPGMYELRQLNFTWLELMNEHPEYFYDDVEVEIVYGNPQFCIWDGGRIFGRYTHTTAEELSVIINTYNNHFNKPIRYVFTSATLEPKHYIDRFGNMMLALGNEYHNEVVLVDDGLRDYIACHYQTYKFVSSTTKCITDKAECLNEIHKDEFKLVCLDYNLNKNMAFLTSMTPEEKAKTEFLINAICPPACPHRKHHYYLNSMSHLDYARHYAMEGCGIGKSTFDPDMQNHSNNLTYDVIKNVYAPMGFEHFKIEGRTWDNMSALVTYAEYMVKPEFKDLVIVSIGSRLNEFSDKVQK